MDSKIDFLPERVKAQRSLRRRIVRQSHLLALVALGLGTWGYLSAQRVARAQAELSLLGERSAGSDRLLAQKARLQQDQAELMIKDRISRQLGSRAEALDVLAELQRVLPPGVSLVSLNLDCVQLQLPAEAAGPGSRLVRPSVAAPGSVTVNRIRLVLTGLAPSDVDVANLIGQLSASPLFEDLHLGYTKNTVLKDRRAREFQVSCHVVR